MEKECIAMLLAGGQGSRLGALTKNIAKPAVSFGGKYRMIDFSLSNCSNSHIDTVGVLTQYRPFQLNSYIANGAAWDFSGLDGGIYVLPPYETQTGGQWYMGTADAIYQNLEFMEMYNPKYVLILSGDHLYRMDYRKMLESHIAAGADATISTIQVSWEEASRFGIITADENHRIVKFTEKPKEPDSNLASMGIYIFNADLLKEKLIEDAADESSEHDFGKNIIPNLLAEGRKLNCYEFEGFWKDVGTIPSYYETSIALLDPEPEFDLASEDFPLMCNANIYPVQYIGADATVKDSMINNGCKVYGTVIHSLVGNNCIIDKGAVVKDTIVLPGTHVCADAKVEKAILGENSVVDAGAVFGDAKGEIAVLGNAEHAK